MKKVILSTLLGIFALSTTSQGKEVKEEFEWSEKITSTSNRKRIVGGTEVSPPLKYNFITPLLDGAIQSCSGTLIHPSWVLTAGHCVFGHLYQTSPGSSRHNISLVSLENNVVHKIDFRVVHPLYTDVYPEGFDGGFSEYDAALYHLETPATITDPNIQMIELDRTGQFSQPGTMSKVIGWGVLDIVDYIAPDNLMEVDVPITTETVCKTAYPFIHSSNLCAGYPEGLRDACYGDSGGPLFTVDPVSGKYIQNGIVSSGKECALPGYPGTYTYIPSIISWIDDTIQNAKNPCSNSSICGVGKCFSDYYPDYRCVCPASHSGKNCEIQLCPSGPSSTCRIFKNSQVIPVERGSTKEINLSLSGLPAKLTPDIGFSVTVKVSHFRSSLVGLSLFSPSGKEIILTPGVYGGPLNNCYTETVFDDSYLPIYNSTCPFKEVGSFQPLKDLNNEPLNGMWKLRFTNLSPYRNPTFLGWGIRITTCRPGYMREGLTCKPDLRTQKAMTFSIIQRFLFNGSTIDSNGSGNSFRYNDGKALMFSTIPRNSDQFNKALNINRSPAISSKTIQLSDSSFTLEIVFRVNNMMEFDLFSLMTSIGAPLNTSPLRIQITSLGRLRLFSKSKITHATIPLITRGTTYYLVIAFRSSQMFMFLNDARIASTIAFPPVAPSNYFLSLSRAGQSSIDELALFDMSLTGIQAMSRNDDF